MHLENPTKTIIVILIVSFYLSPPSPALNLGFENNKPLH